MKITSLQNPLIKETAKLHKKKYRDSTGTFLVEGYHLYEEAKNVGNIVRVFTTDDSIQGKEVIHVSNQVLEKLAKAQSVQGVLTVCNKVYSQELSNKVLILEKLQDPGNLGTLMRSALAFGFNTIVLDNTVDIYNDKVLRSTQGAIFKLNIIERDTLTFMKEHPNYIYYGTEMNGMDIEDIECDELIAVILGNEGNGVSKNVLENTDKNITIKMKETESLNVGVAGSILMHHIMRLK